MTVCREKMCEIRLVFFQSKCIDVNKKIISISHIDNYKDTFL